MGGYTHDGRNPLFYCGSLQTPGIYKICSKLRKFLIRGQRILSKSRSNMLLI